MTGTARDTLSIRQLPIQLKPRAGEGRTAFIERLATANFLKPSYLRAYLQDPSNGKGPSWERLAAATGRDSARLAEILERKQCVECGRPLPLTGSLPLTDKHNTRRRCSRVCLQKNYRERRPEAAARPESVRITNCQECDSRLTTPQQRQYCSTACRYAAYRKRQNAAAPPELPARNCPACEAPILSGPTTKIYCSRTCSRWAYANRHLIPALPALHPLAADIPLGFRPAKCIACGTPITQSPARPTRLTCSTTCRRKRAYWRKKARLTTTT